MTLVTTALVLVRAGGSVSVVCQARVCSRSQHPSSDLLTSYGATAAKQDNARTQPPQYHDLCGRLSIPKMYQMLDIKVFFKY